MILNVRRDEQKRNLVSLIGPTDQIELDSHLKAFKRFD